MEKKKIVTVPNALSFYRLLAFPLILWFIISGKEQLFAILGTTAQSADRTV